MYAWVLFITLSFSNPHPIAIPMQSQEACEIAKAQLEQRYKPLNSKLLTCIKQYKPVFRN